MEPSPSATRNEYVEASSQKGINVWRPLHKMKQCVRTVLISELHRIFDVYLRSVREGPERSTAEFEYDKPQKQIRQEP